MNKSELVGEIVDRADIGKAKAEAALNAAIDAITQELKAGALLP